MDDKHPWVWYLRGVTVTGIICGALVWTVCYGINRQFDMSLKSIEHDKMLVQMYYKAQAECLNIQEEKTLEYWKWLKERKLKPVPDPLSEEKESKATKEKKFELLPAPHFESQEEELKSVPVPAPNPFLEFEEGWKPTPDSRKKEKDDVDGDSEDLKPIPFPINRGSYAQDYSGFGPNPSPWPIIRKKADEQGWRPVQRAPRTFAPSD